MLNIPDYVFNWLVDFFEGHSQCTKFGNKISPLEAITAGVIQGSAIGPASFLVCASDLHPTHKGNHHNKYADDVYLIVPASNSQTCATEIQHIANWAADNNLKLNQSKSFEMIVASSTSKLNNLSQIPAPLPNIARVDSLVMLGVTLQHNLRMTTHVAEKVSSCSRSLYALKVLKAHGMPKTELQEVFRATTLASLLHAVPAWWGFTLAEDRDRLNAFLNKCKNAGLYPIEGPSIEAIVTKAEQTLFDSIKQDHNHVLHPYLPPKADRHYNLRTRVHPYTIPAKTTSLADKNYFTRLLYRNCY